MTQPLWFFANLVEVKLSQQASGNMSIVEITVYAFGNQRIWQKVPAMTRYTVVVEKGVVI